VDASSNRAFTILGSTTCHRLTRRTGGSRGDASGRDGPKGRRRRTATSLKGGERDQASRHDYRPNLTRFLNEVYGLGATEDQLSRVELALAQREEARERLFERPKPKTRRGS
jgi:hypothetical protein